MSSNVLEKIVSNKRDELQARKLAVPLATLTTNLQPSQRSLKTALSNPQSDFIFECKKASPSKGLLRDPFDLDEILASYKKHASAISVLTDKKYFHGSHQHLKKVCQTVSQPVLCKDFFIDNYQIFEARYYGADAILLMLSVLSDTEYTQLAKTAKTLNLDVLTEVHDPEELQRALDLDAEIIGINNRNLKDLSIHLTTTENLMQSLSPQQKKDKVFISESGIRDHHDVKRLSTQVDGFLVGSSIMEKSNIDKQCKELLYGRVKICGLNGLAAAKSAHNNGAIYGGLIFHPKSPRYIDPKKALSFVNEVPLDYVGVFVNADKSIVVEVANTLKLKIVQLHGNEDSYYIDSISRQLPQCKIWKALSVKDKLTSEQLALFSHHKIDKILLDTYSTTQKGGTGEIFNWQILQTLATDKIVLAGGLNIENIIRASHLNCFAMDINSGVESSAGIKDPALIAALLKRLRN